MKVAVVVLALFAVAAYAQQWSSGQGNKRRQPPCPTDLGVTQEQCDSMHTCMMNSKNIIKANAGTSGTKPTKEERKAQMEQAKKACAQANGISDTVLEMMKSRRRSPPSGPAPPTQA